MGSEAKRQIVQRKIESRSKQGRATAPTSKQDAFLEYSEVMDDSGQDGTNGSSRLVQKPSTSSFLGKDAFLKHFQEQMEKETANFYSLTETMKKDLTTQNAAFEQAIATLYTSILNTDKATPKTDDEIRPLEATVEPSCHYLSTHANSAVELSKQLHREYTNLSETMKKGYSPDQHTNGYKKDYQVLHNHLESGKKAAEVQIGQLIGGQEEEYGRKAIEDEEHLKMFGKQKLPGKIHTWSETAARALKDIDRLTRHFSDPTD